MIYLREFKPSDRKVNHPNLYELENVRFMYDFFMKYRDKFENEQGL